MAAESFRAAVQGCGRTRGDARGFATRLRRSVGLRADGAGSPGPGGRPLRFHQPAEDPAAPVVVGR